MALNHDLQKRRSNSRSVRAGRTPEPRDPDAETARLRKIAHDMRSSIGAIQIWTHLLKEGQLGAEEVSRAIATIENSVVALDEQIRKLLADP